jgi:hypothetical protein
VSERTNFRLMFSRSILWCSLTLTLVPMHALPQTSRRITLSFALWRTFCRRVPILGRAEAPNVVDSRTDIDGIFVPVHHCPSSSRALAHAPRSGWTSASPPGSRRSGWGVGFAPDAALPLFPLRLLPFRVSIEVDASRGTRRHIRGDDFLRYQA